MYVLDLMDSNYYQKILNRTLIFSAFFLRKDRVKRTG